jgi:Peptidase family M1 domain/Calcineurin-like phosphoesterase
MSLPSRSSGVGPKGRYAPTRLTRRPVMLLLLFIWFLPLACRFTTQPAEIPTAVPSTPYPTYANPLTSPEPADQAAALLAGLPATPTGLTQYALRISLDDTNHSFMAQVRVDYTNAEDVALDRLYFRLYPNAGQTYGNGYVSVNQVLVNGQPVVTNLRLLDSILEVMLPAALNPGEEISLDFDTSGLVPVDYGGGGIATGYGIFNYSDGVLALANFYPILAVYNAGGWELDPVYPFGDAVYSDAALYTVEVLSDPGLILATSGVWVSQQEVEGQILRRFVSGPARDFFIIASPDYQITSRQVGGTTVNAYYLPGHEESGDQAVDTAARSLEIYSAQFGPYPYAEYDVVEAPLNRPSGVEYPGVGLIASRLYADPTSVDLTSTVAHEVAHQWWYNVVGNDTIREPWLDEALTTYSSVVYWEQVGGISAEEQALAYHRARYEQNAQNGWDAPVTEGMTYFQETGRTQSYSPVVYSKGALFYQDLRQTMGDEAFFKALQTYYAAHWFTIATTSELLGTFQAAASEPLDGLFQTWLYSPTQGSLTSTPNPEPTLPPTPEPTATLAPPPVVFAAIGDYGSDDPAEENVANLVLSWQPDFIITLGDNNYPNGEAYTIDNAIGQYFHSFIYPYEGHFGDGADSNRFFPCLGNHDVLTDDGQPYYNYFSLPGNERYYDFTWGPLHFFALNNNDSEPDGVRVSSRQAAWLRDGLAASSSAWDIVYMHYPPYSSGNHGSTSWAQWPYAEWGAEVVLSAHDHDYERLTVNGIPYFVNGLGGGGIYDFGDLLGNSLERYNDDYGALRVEATGEYISFEFVTRRGETVDYFELRR